MRLSMGRKACDSDFIVFDPAKSESEYPTRLHKEFLGYHNPKLTVHNRYLMILFTANKCENFGLD